MILSVLFFGRFGSIVVFVGAFEGGVSTSDGTVASGTISSAGTITGITVFTDLSGSIGFTTGFLTGRTEPHCIPTQKPPTMMRTKPTNWRKGFIDIIFYEVSCQSRDESSLLVYDRWSRRHPGIFLSYERICQQHVTYEQNGEVSKWDTRRLQRLQSWRRWWEHREK